MAGAQPYAAPAQEREAEIHSDETRHASASVVRGRWLVILLVALGVLTLIALWYGGLLPFR